jgi:hypothetical protein
LDSNNDGKIDNQDTNFNNLKIWQDKNSDGKLDINKRLTNHSAREFLLQQLRENNVEGRAIIQIGHTK